MNAHAVAAIFPEMTGDDFAALKSDIAEHGQREPIMLYDGQILDGRNRFRACSELGIEPKTRQWSNGQSPVDYVVSVNLHRRHLSQSQRAMVSLEVETAKAKEAKANQRASGGDKKSDAVKGKSVLPKSGKPIHAAKEAAKLMKVSKGYVSDAKRIATEAPALAKKVKAGELTIPEAKRELKRTENAAKLADWKANPPPPTTTVNLILADPPWQYDFAETESRAIENQYSSATVDEIKKHIGDKQMPDVADDCVLLLWATAPKLQEALAVMAAWGFTYKTHAVWDKQKIGMGYWFRGQHELLLVGTKGKASPPDDTQRVGSIFSEARGKHSAKPACVYEWIERAFPMQSKLEMYCRKPRTGWQAFGNEAQS